MSRSDTPLRIVLVVNYLDRAYQSSFRGALQRAALARGVDLLVAVGREIDHELGHERALNHLYRWLSAESVQGVVLLSAAISNFSGLPGVQRLCASLLPVPSCSIGLELPDVPSLVIDNRAAMKAAVTHLIAVHGCRHIGYIGGPDYNEEARARLVGYRDAVEEAGLGFDPLRVSIGQFTTETGHAALLELLGRGVTLDGLVAANDYMALGAVDALFERGLRVPEAVRVVGFDDAPIARFARRSLTTVAQPFDDLAAQALDALIGQLRGRPVAPLQSAEVRMVMRESCGCGYLLAPGSSRAAAPERPPAPHLRAWAAELDRERAAGAQEQDWQRVLPALARGLALEMDGTPGAFLACVEQVADELSEAQASPEALGRALIELDRGCQTAGYRGKDYRELERACLEGQAKASAIAHREDGRRALTLMDGAAAVRSASQDLAMVLSAPALAKSFGKALRDLGIPTGYLAMCSDERGLELRPLLALEAGAVLELDPSPYPARQLFPRGFPRGPDASFLTLLPLTVEDQVMGLVAFSSRAEPFVCETLRSQLSAAIKLGSLHARVVEETAVRERLAHEQLLGEMAVARRIQGALCPEDLAVPGFELAARLVAADQVGGDYYDVIPASDGCWIGIGDVTGHGLMAGLIMLMLQSSVSTAIHEGNGHTPADVVCGVNRVLYSNIRRRLRVKDHATFLILRAHRDGRLLMAGAHEDVIVYRRATGACELLETTGVWLGINEDIREATTNQAFQLEAGDTLVLYTDGLTEARDAAQRVFELERVCELVKATAAQGPKRLVETLTEAARAWTPVQQDDITVLALRRSG